MLRALAVAVLAAAGFGPGWLTFGNDVSRSSAGAKVAEPVRARWSTQLVGRITSQPLVLRASSGTTVFVATSAGRVYALSGAGRIRWSSRVGKLAHPCGQLDGYGVTGTPLIDRARRTLYAADALGRLHALALDTGKERQGWPVQIFEDFRAELVWGALTAAGGSVYIPTGAYCDAPMVGKVIRVQLSTRQVSQWIVVPPEQGGGGGIWGWGGLAYSRSRDSLLAVTGNAFRGGSNDGDRFREWAGYGEQLVELSPRLRVRSASHPKDVNKTDDLDFVGSPVVVSRRACDELVVAANKNGRLYAWKTSRISAGPVWSVRLVPSDPKRSLLAQPAYSKSLHAVFASTARGLVKVEITSKCLGRVAWTRRLGAVNSTATIAGTTVWVVGWHRNAALLGIDGRGGAIRVRRALGKHTYYVGPAVVGGRIYLGSFDGLVRVFG